jgi:glycosyltransferase involved in cell wall biosynthesis
LLRSHFFILPTLNENFGYVVVEAMAAGCPVLISENTIWGGVEEAGCGRVLPLALPNAWVKALEDAAAMSEEEYTSRSERARQFALDWPSLSGEVEANRRVFQAAMETRSHRVRNAG